MERGHRDYYWANPEKYREIRRRYYIRHHEDELTRRRKYQETHRERLRARQKEYRQTHRAQIQARQKEYRRTHRKQTMQYVEAYRRLHEGCRKAEAKRHRNRMKRTVFAAYSPTLTCENCGFADLRALTIDHVRGDGWKFRHEHHRSGLSMWVWLKLNNYPPGFQVLCMNCQFIKREENGEHGKRQAAPTQLANTNSWFSSNTG